MIEIYHLSGIIASIISFFIPDREYINTNGPERV